MATEAQEQSERLWSAMLGFALLAVLGPLLGWSTGDLLWGLVLASLATSLIAATLGIISIWRLGWRKVSLEDRRQRLAYLVQTPFLGFFALALLFMCYGFHHFYGFFIYFLFPLWPEVENAFDLTNEQQQQILAEAASRYWPFVIATLASDWRRLFRPLVDPQPLDLARPWTLLFRMHLFIFLSIAVMLTAGTGYVFYLLILLFFFFPWTTAYRYFFQRDTSPPPSPPPG